MKKRYILFLVSISLVPLVFSASSPEKKERLDIYLCIGQSNMAGRARITEDLAAPLENVYLLNGRNEFEAAANPLNKYSTIRKGLGMQHLCMAYSFSIEMQKATGRKIGLVVNARGGSSILAWQKGADEGYYEKLLERARAALKYGRIKGIIWHQGESDIAREGMPGIYKEYLSRLVSDLRKDLHQKRLPVVVGQIGSWVRDIEKSRSFNNMLNEVPEFVPHTAVAASQGLESRGDNLHFNTTAQLELGRRYAAAMLILQE